MKFARMGEGQEEYDVVETNRLFARSINTEEMKKS